MVRMFIGLNGNGKTLMLRNIQRNLKNKYSIVSNLRNYKYEGFDKTRLELLLTDDNFDTIFDYHEVIKTNDKLVILTSEDDGEKEVYSSYFTNILTLLCRKGDILILDEPEYGLYSDEIKALCDILELLKETYVNIFIATHCSRLFYLSDKAFWIENYVAKEITEEELYEHIGKIRR